jgi:putative flippase GtrA
MLTSGLGALVDTAVLWFFSKFVFDSYVGDYIISPIISFEAAVLCNYFCAYKIIWGKRIPKKTKKTFLGRYLLYNASCSMVFLIKMGILLLIEKFTGWNVVICNLCALCISGCVNYAMNEWVIFKDRKLKRQADQDNSIND